MDILSKLEQRLLFLGIALMFLAFTLWVSNGGSFNLTPTRAYALASDNSLTYYGADLSSGGGMEKATGVSATNHFTHANSAPWPQYTGNYCFVAAVQAIANYEYWKIDPTQVKFPDQSDQGP